MPKHTRAAWCYWCAEKNIQKGMYKLRQGPLDWYFCNEQHARLWRKYRYRAETAALLRTCPVDRECGDIEDAISRALQKNENTASCERAHDLRNVPCNQVSVCEDTELSSD